MSLDFKEKDVMHGIIAKYVQAFLSGAKKDSMRKLCFNRSWIFMVLPARPVCITLLLTDEFTEEVDCEAGKAIAVNAPCTLKVIVPGGLIDGDVYTRGLHI